MPMNTREYWQEGMDAKRFALRLQRSIWILLAAALAGALFAGGLYWGIRRIQAGPPQYRAEVLYFIGYDIQEEDETLKAFINEYNAYTWGDMMRSDKVVCYVTEQLPDVERSVLEACLDTAITSDPEFLTATFTTKDPALSDRIAAAYTTAMESFAKTMQGRGLSKIEAWKTVPAALVEPENKMENAMAFGLILGIFMGGLILTGRYVLDDRICLAEDLAGCDIPVLGYETRERDPYWTAQLQAALAHVAGSTDFQTVEAEKLLQETVDYAALQKKPVVLQVVWGRMHRRMLLQLLRQLKLQDVRLLGLVITQTEDRFVNRYYGKGRK